MKNFIKKILSKNKFIYQTLKKINDIRKGNFYWDFDVLNRYVSYKKDISFIQIGSNNGLNGDPICHYIKKYKWKGVLVEPVPFLFDELKKNYVGFDDTLFFENCAIAKESGKQKFYRLKESDKPGLPDWYDQIGSFKKEVILKHRDMIPFFDELFFEDSVNALTFSQIIEKYQIKELNLMHIDTEGYDYEIIKMIPFTDFDIDLIMFEHAHLSDSDYKKAKLLLQKNGYKVGFKSGADTIAIKKHLQFVLAGSKK